ncbi:hypothetical protein [Amorphus coralli]|uniref:hypothetical protein n=1 Tax=Amorphus coralli TaxID=340680 RepID=UPI001AEC16EE|nr:hypothetical protein [Amorphus coralli]
MTSEKVFRNDRTAAGDGDARPLHDTRLRQRFDIRRQRDIARPPTAKQLTRRVRPDADSIALVAANHEDVAVLRAAGVEADVTLPAVALAAPEHDDAADRSQRVKFPLSVRAM